MDDLKKYLGEVIKTTKMEKVLKDPDAKIVTICGPLSKDVDSFNTKFMVDIQSELSKLNCLPFIPIISSNTDFLEKKDIYRISHLKKIAMSDIVIFVNIWGDDSYNGPGTNLEIEFSRLANKIILYTYKPNNDEYTYELYKDLVIDHIPLFRETKVGRELEIISGALFHRGDGSWL